MRMYGYGYGYYGFDWTYVLLIIGMLLSLAASTRLKSTFSYYRRIRSASGLTGAETAERILRAAGMSADMQFSMQSAMHHLNFAARSFRWRILGARFPGRCF